MYWRAETHRRVGDQDQRDDTLLMLLMPIAGDARIIAFQPTKEGCMGILTELAVATGRQGDLPLAW